MMILQKKLIRRKNKYKHDKAYVYSWEEVQKKQQTNSILSKINGFSNNFS